MAGKYSRVDGRKSSSNLCSSILVSVFVGVCLLAVWLLSASSVTPIPNLEVSGEVKDDVKTPVTKGNVGSASDVSIGIDQSAGDSKEEESQKQFEDNPGDLPEDATKGDTNVSLNQEDKSAISEETSVGKQELVNTDDDKKTNEEEKENGSKDESESREEIKDNEDSQVENNQVNEDGERGEGQIEEKTDSSEDDKSDQGSVEKDGNSVDIFPSGPQSELSDEPTTQKGSFPTQATESKKEKEVQQASESESQNSFTWKLCNTTAGTDYIPCLDNLVVIRNLPTTKHYEHRERHCPEDPPTCLVPLPDGYQRSIPWPTSREKIWYHNVPHTKLAEVKGHQNWVKVSGEYLTFPGGGTQFKYGALHYIDFIQQSVSEVAWGKRSRVILDVGCGVASFGGFLFDRDVLAMSLAPKDEHEAQVQFALERGIPAISAVMGTLRLPFPGRVFDIVHCARCRVPWHIEGGKLLLELNRLLRPGGFFVWSATPIYQKLPEDVEIWQAMNKLTKEMCWEVISITKDIVNNVGIAIFKKPTTNECYEQRSKNNPPLCQDSDDPSAAWNVPLQACMHKVPVAASERGAQWPEMWPARVENAPYWLSSSDTGVYGKPAPEDFLTDYEHWKNVFENSYENGLGINWSTVRNVMDMRAVYGGLAAALRDLKLWVMNVVSIDAPDTLPIIYERGLFGIYHDWCESFNTYPRSYDLLHADHLFSKIKKKCNFMALVSEVDRILRPEGSIVIRDSAETITELESLFKSMQWTISMTYSKDKVGLLCAQKSMWRPTETETLTYAA